MKFRADLFRLPTVAFEDDDAAVRVRREHQPLRGGSIEGEYRPEGGSDVRHGVHRIIEEDDQKRVKYQLISRGCRHGCGVAHTPYGARRGQCRTRASVVSGKSNTTVCKAS